MITKISGSLIRNFSVRDLTLKMHTSNKHPDMDLLFWISGSILDELAHTPLLTNAMTKPFEFAAVLICASE